MVDVTLGAVALARLMIAIELFIRLRATHGTRSVTIEIERYFNQSTVLLQVQLRRRQERKETTLLSLYSITSRFQQPERAKGVLTVMKTAF